MADITVNITDVVKSNNVKTFSNKTMSYTQNNITVHSSGVIGYQGYAIQAGSVAFNPADSTVLYFAQRFDVAPQTTEQNTRITIPKTGTIKAFAAYQRMTTTVGTAEVSTLEMNVNGSLSTITTLFDNGTNNKSDLYTGLSIAVVQGNYCNIKWTPPIWVTNPVGLSLGFIIYME